MATPFYSLLISLSLNASQHFKKEIEMNIRSEIKTILVKEADAARILCLEVTTLRRWRWAGTGPNYIKIGAAVRYDEQDLKDFIAAGRKSSASSISTCVG
jgi:hypothetical protein